MRRSEMFRAAGIALSLTAALTIGACSADGEFGKLPVLSETAPFHPERNPLYNVPRNGANQPVDQYGVPLLGYGFQPR